jgi:hypothetical protein
LVCIIKPLPLVTTRNISVDIRLVPWYKRKLRNWMWWLSGLWMSFFYLPAQPLLENDKVCLQCWVHSLMFHNTQARGLWLHRNRIQLEAGGQALFANYFGLRPMTFVLCSVSWGILWDPTEERRVSV